jgi:hypothetical protein
MAPSPEKQKQRHPLLPADFYKWTSMTPDGALRKVEGEMSGRIASHNITTQKLNLFANQSCLLGRTRWTPLRTSRKMPPRLGAWAPAVTLGNKSLEHSMPSSIALWLLALTRIASLIGGPSFCKSSVAHSPKSIRGPRPGETPKRDSCRGANLRSGFWSDSNELLWMVQSTPKRWKRGLCGLPTTWTNYTGGFGGAVFPALALSSVSAQPRKEISRR